MINADFAAFVREASFHLTLSEQMIMAILHVERDSADPKMGYGAILSRSTSNALYRRGLIVPAGKIKVPEECLNQPGWPYDYLLTEAGRLVAGLLREAGFKCDPRPFLVNEEEIEIPSLTLK